MGPVFDLHTCTYTVQNQSILRVYSGDPLQLLTPRTASCPQKGRLAPHSTGRLRNCPNGVYSTKSAPSQIPYRLQAPSSALGFLFAVDLYLKDDWKTCADLVLKAAATPGEHTFLAHRTHFHIRPSFCTSAHFPPRRQLTLAINRQRRK